MAMNGTRKAVGAALAVTGALALALGVGALPRAGAEEGPYPVWWSPRLELESLDAIDERLARPIWPEGPAITLATLPEDGPGDWLKPETWIRAEAKSCRDLLRLVEAGYGHGGGGISYPIFLGVLADCRAIAHLMDARPARVSFVRDFQLDEHAFKYLPSLLMASGGSCYGLCNAFEDNKHRAPLGGSVAPSVVTRDDPYTSTYEEGDLVVRFEIVGIADFDGDGVEDLMVENFWRPSSRPNQGTEVFLIGRSRPDEVFQVRDAARYLCPDYGCDHR